MSSRVPAVRAAAAVLWILGAAAAVDPAPIRVSLDTEGGNPDGDSSEPTVTPNGRFVAFHSSATDLVPGTTNDTADVYVLDRKTGVLRLVSEALGGGEGNGASRYPNLSSNGRYVLFDSVATDLVQGLVEDDAGRDVFLADLRTGEIRRLSGAADGGNADAGSELYGACLSANGRVATFLSQATDLVDGLDTHGYYQVYLHDAATGVTRIGSADRDDPALSATGTCGGPSLSPNGRFLAFSCNSANIVPGNSNGQMHVYVRDLKRNTAVRASQTAEGEFGSSGSYGGVVPSNGRSVAYYTYAANLGEGDTPGETDVVLTTLEPRSHRNLSAGGGSGESYTPSISASGKTVVFSSGKGSLATGDDNEDDDVFLFDVPSGTLRLASATAAGAPGNGDSYNAPSGLSGNGRWLALYSHATNLVADPEDDGARADVFLLRLR